MMMRGMEWIEVNEMDPETDPKMNAKMDPKIDPKLGLKMDPEMELLRMQECPKTFAFLVFPSR